MKRFRSGNIMILICTELLGRGIDFKCVNLVINYDFPQSAISYIHRIGTVFFEKVSQSFAFLVFFTAKYLLFRFRQNWSCWTNWTGGYVFHRERQSSVEKHR